MLLFYVLFSDLYGKLHIPTLYANSILETKTFDSLLQHMVMVRPLKQLLEMCQAITLNFTSFFFFLSG